MILRFSVQALVENAVKHGIARQKEGGLISIKIVPVLNAIKISVRNPGHFQPDIQREGLGLKNLNERLQLQYKGQAKFDIINETGSTVLAAILIP
jgi:LytS/YehU family sensor histidine kinase